EGTRIGPSATAKRPGIARHYKLIPRDVRCIEVDPEEFALAIVHLCIKQYPTFFSIVPVFRHPMVEVFALFKIGAESAASTRRNTLRAQHRDVKKRKVPTDTDLPRVSHSQCAKRPAIARYDVIQDLLDRANVGLSFLVAAERYPVGRCNVLMDQQTLHGF